jgi:hypothetical protein
MAPEIARGLRGESADEEVGRRRARLWGYLAALDRSTERRPIPPTNALLLAVLLLPPLRDALDPDTNGVRDVGRLVGDAVGGALERLRPSRRDSEIARRILLELRKILPGRRRRDRPDREFVDESLRLAEIVSDAEAADPALAGRPIIAEGGAAVEPEPDDDLPLPDVEGYDSGRGRYGRRGGRDGRGDRDRGGPPPGPRPAPAAMLSSPQVRTDLGSLAAAARSLLTPDLRPTFCGTGIFGGPWNRAD